jgi:transcriptional regulator with XRE-family HTH domain
MSISPTQAKAARKLLGWSLSDLASCVGVGETAIGLFERGQRRSPALDVSVLRKVLESAGVAFASGAEPGVKLKAKARTIAAEGK